jgi:hypothetical protein
VTMRRRTLLCLCSDIWPQKNVAVVPHPPYSPDLTPCDFFFFPRMNSKIKGRRFQVVTEILEQSLTVLHEIPKSQFQRVFQQRQKRWTRCITRKGNTLKWTVMSNTKGKRIFRDRLSPETSGYTLVCVCVCVCVVTLVSNWKQHHLSH